MRHFVLAIGLLGITSTTAAWAVEPPKSINEPPKGPGAELKDTLLPVPDRVVPGWEAEAFAGGGEGFGFGARGGYTIDRGVYLGGAVTHWFGSSFATINGDQRTSRNQVGGEIGYKMFFLDRALEIRPFVFLGPDFYHRFHEDTRSMSSNTAFGVHTSGLVAYRFGQMFIAGEVRVMITPTPAQVAGLGGVGLAL